MPPPTNVVAAMERIMEDIRSGAVSDDYFLRDSKKEPYVVTDPNWPGGLSLSILGLSRPNPPNDIGYRIMVGNHTPYKYVLYVDNPSENPAVNRRAVLGGYHFLMTTHHSALLMHRVAASEYI